jgi:hypothetical protein
MKDETFETCKRPSPSFILLCENSGCSADVIDHLKREWGQMEIFEMVANRELTVEQGVRMLERKRNWLQKLVDWFFV